MLMVLLYLCHQQATQTGNANTLIVIYGIGYRRCSQQVQYFSGKIDQVRIFQKALSSSQVSTLYAETAATVESLDPLSEDTTDTLQVLGDSSCIATYRFENNEDDLSGNYDGTVSGGVQYAAGRYGQAIEFSSGHVNTGHDFNLANNSFSFSFWFANSATGSTNSYVISTDDPAVYPTSQNKVLVIGRKDSSGKLSFGFYMNDLESATSVTTDGTWQHWVCTYNASTNSRKIYLNGSLDASDTASADFQGTGNVEFGFGIYQAYGKLDQVRIFNKEISASEVTTLYNENSLVASYRFEGNANDDTRNYDGTASNVTYEYGLNFTPDFVWIKDRSATRDHNITDSTRGVTHPIYIESNAQLTNSTFLQSFDTGGFTLGNQAAANEDGDDFVAWCLKANGGTTSSNTDGSVTSTVQANQDAGFSIIKYTGNGTAGATIGHGLNSTPEMIIVKNLAAGENWAVYHSATGVSNVLFLNESNAVTSVTNKWAGTNSTVFGVNSAGDINQSGVQLIAYAFHSVEGFSSFGSYTGNGSDNGPIVETGFEPAFVIIKKATDDGLGGGPWQIHDNKRDLTNPRKKYLLANSTNVEAADLNGIDFLSNGFQIKDDYKHYNSNGTTFIYMAFAADPDTEAPTVAKSFSTVTYTGTGSAQTISGLEFKPSLLWTKQTDGTFSHIIHDTLNQPHLLITNSTSALITNGSNTATFTDDGFSLEGGANHTSINNSGSNFVAWAWKADDNEPTIFGGPAIAVYKFEDNANDVTGNNNGSASNVSYVTGKFNKAADFNGSSSFIDVSGITLGDRSISLWVKFDDVTKDYQTIYDTDQRTSPGHSFGDWTLNYYGVNDGAKLVQTWGKHDGSDYEYGTFNFTASNDTWYHIVTVDAPNNHALYINGDKKTYTTIRDAGENRALSSAELTFGQKENTGEALNGQLDQIRIYSGAVSDAGVAELYAETVSDNDDLELGGPPEIIISANANAGFSIVKFEKKFSSSVAEKIPHGLSAAPEMIILKRTDGSEDWYVYHTSLGNAARLQLNSSAAQTTGTNVWGQTNPTSTVFTVESFNAGNAIAYCFHSVAGYSKFGSYAGNGTSQTITTGFQPDFVMLRKYDDNQSWMIFDSVRDGNPKTKRLEANNSNAEATGTTNINFISTGFEFTSSYYNDSGKNSIYWAIKIN